MGRCSETGVNVIRMYGNVWCPWEVGRSKERRAGSNPVTSVFKVLWYDRHLFVAWLCGQAVSPGGHSEAFIGKFKFVLVDIGCSRTRSVGERYSMELLVDVEVGVQFPLRISVTLGISW